jgi:hypothetical protein
LRPLLPGLAALLFCWETAAADPSFPTLAEPEDFVTAKPGEQPQPTVIPCDKPVPELLPPFDPTDPDPDNDGDIEAEEDDGDISSADPYARLTQAAAKEPALKPGYERANFCLLDGQTCRARDPILGGYELVSEALPIYKPIDFSLQQEPEKLAAAEKVFYEFATEEKFEQEANRGAFSGIAKTGLSRALLFHAQFYRLYDHKKFHDSAEGLDLLNAMATDYEKSKQEEIAAALERIKKQAQLENWSQPEKDAVDSFLALAQARSHNLGVVSCQLHGMAGVNRDIENRQSSLADNGLGGPPAGSGVTAGSADRSLSSMTGDPENATNLQSRKTGSNLLKGFSEILQPFENYLGNRPVQGNGSGKNTNTVYGDGIGGPEDDLFKRVHRKYRQKDAEGVFLKSILD